MLENATVLITGGTGSFGKTMTRVLLERFNPRKIIIYSRDEFKQYHMKNEFEKIYSKEKCDKLRFFIGDVRDKDRLYRAFKNVDYVIHAAAMKQVPACEYNPFEAIKTNIHGAQNIVDAALDCGVKKVVALSTDKAVNPINLYGGTKLVSDKLFVSANAYSGENGTVFSVVRYGNVAGSRGSVIPLFSGIHHSGSNEYPITDTRMTRFWITLDEGVNLVLRALEFSRGGETFISKIPSFRITDLAYAFNPNAILKEIGIREGEKLHEVMITADDSRMTYEYDTFYVIYPNYDWFNVSSIVATSGKKVPDDFVYSSEINQLWLSKDELSKYISLMKI